MSYVRSSTYDPRSFPPVAVTVDIVLFTIRSGALQVLLIERGIEPFLGSWALPGGFVLPEEDLDTAAARELAEETGIGTGAAYLEQLATYGDPDRDPRMRVVTVAYWAVCARVPPLVGGSDAARAELIPVSRIEADDIELAFDHRRIAAYAVERLRAKLEYTAVAARFCGPEFTISELRRVYEAVWNTKLDPGNFQRKVRENHAFARIGEEGTGTSLASLLFQASPLLGPMAPSIEGPSEVGSGEVEAEGATADGEGASDWHDDRENVVMQRIDMGEHADAERVHTRPRTGRLVNSPGPRGGRPASLWTAVDPKIQLNSPIARRRPPKDAGSG